MKGLKKTLKTLFVSPKYRLVTFISLFAIVGVAVLLITHATAPYLTIEPENGSKSGVTVCNDSTASNNQCVQFGTASSGTTRIVAAGDIACSAKDNPPCSNAQTAQIIQNLNPFPSAALLVGDLAYHFGSGSNFGLPGCTGGTNSTYDTTWGIQKILNISYPAVGNHEYYYASTWGGGKAGDISCKQTNNSPDPLKPYYTEFQGNLSRVLTSQQIANRITYYSFNVGGWHIISIDSICDPENPAGAAPVTPSSIREVYGGGCGATSPEVTWLKNDLQNNKTKCTMAYFHKPYVTENTAVGQSTPLSATLSSAEAEHLDDVTGYTAVPQRQASLAAGAAAVGSFSHYASLSTIWQTLYDNKVDVVVNGHIHDYLHYKNLNRAGDGVDTYSTVGGNQINNGIEEFIIGTGGAGLTPMSGPFTTALYKYADKMADRGVMVFDLTSTGLTYTYKPMAGSTFSDSGSLQCH